jgi:methyl-accepting chemotaxis protein
MKWFYDLKIGTKLLTAFVLVGAITAVVGYMGITNMGKISDLAEKMYAKDMLGMVYIKNANTDLIYVGRAEKNLLLSTTAEERTKYTSAIDKSKASVNEDIEKAKDLLYTDKGKELMTKFEQAWKEREDILDQIVALGEKDDLQKKRESTALSFGLGRQKSDAAEDLLKELANLKETNAKQAADLTTQTYQQSRTFMIVLVLGGVLIGLGLGTFISRIISKPVGHAVEVLEAVAGGDLTRRIDVDTKDEIGQMGEALNSTLNRLTESMAAIGESSTALASSSEELSAVSHQMSSNAEETATQSNVVSAAAEQVTKNLQTVATATEEMSSSIKEIAKNSNEAARVATSAVKTAETTNATVAKPGESSAEIGQVIKVITSIAQQTNLLALNATIEAARAGEAGKGFAVVANEVKELAKETAKATEDISRKIETIQGDTKGAVEAIGEISGVISQINDISSTIASAVEEQTATTNEISRNVQEAARGGSQVTENILAVAQAAKSTTQGANDTQTAAAELARMAAELQKVVAQFKYADSARGSGTADFRSTAKQTRDAHLASLAKTQPSTTSRVQ